MIYNLSTEYDLKRFRERSNKLIEAGKYVELKEVKHKRTIKQNKYLHVCITLWAIHYGSTLEEAKVDLKRECGFMVYEKNGNKYLKHTRDLNTEELTEFIEWIRNYASMNGCYIPTSEEYILHQYEIDKTINEHKQYL